MSLKKRKTDYFKVFKSVNKSMHTPVKVKKPKQMTKMLNDISTSFNQEFNRKFKSLNPEAEPEDEEKIFDAQE